MGKSERERERERELKMAELAHMGGWYGSFVKPLCLSAFQVGISLIM